MVSKEYWYCDNCNTDLEEEAVYCYPCVSASARWELEKRIEKLEAQVCAETDDVPDVRTEYDPLLPGCLRSAIERISRVIKEVEGVLDAPLVNDLILAVEDILDVLKKDEA